jgi:type II secretory ATPase GspE/PulE/Tfp pilus assembly ATPase PilB-like protein
MNQAANADRQSDRSNEPSPPRDPSSGVVRLVDELLARSLASGASDVHFEPTDECLLVRIRVDGRLRDFEQIPRNLCDNVVARLKVMAGLLTYRIDIPQEGGLRWPPTEEAEPAEKTDLRVATFPTVRGERAVVRVFRAHSPVETLDQLGLTDEQVECLQQATLMPGGLVPVTGPAGSGKTTTLYAMVRHILTTTPERSVVTLEDPVEQRINRVAQIQVNPYGDLTYERCLRSLLRQDPQIILLGEIRDADTAAVAVEASLTGHLILTTMHSGDPAEAVVRLLEMGVPAYQLVSSVAVVCSQRLLRRRHGAGDDDYAGRIACAEIVRLNDTARELVLSHASVSALRHAFSAQGPSLYERATGLADAGMTDRAEVHRVLGSPREPDEHARG